ncbi:MAG: hypothetical protein COB15_06745 [Flavobacteriales bacterium]|nr:MAG: hypothetical protein COB15_06745 [Flavobacteriales bacterium]
MDIISHTLTGVAVGTLIATLSNENWRKKVSIILIGAFGGALPDFDAISLWSKFDSTIGSFLSLEHTGSQIYFGKFWYSHHAAFHSVLAPIFLILISIIFNSLFKKKIKEHLVLKKYSFLAFFIGFTFHIIEDMPTPACVWGGVNLFYPSSEYIGGYGKIWWWNNYDLVLIMISTIVLILLLNLIPKTLYTIKKYCSIGVFLFGLFLGIYQINTRPVDFSYSGHTIDYDKFEAESKLIQKEILGENLFQIMTTIDNKIPLNF